MFAHGYELKYFMHCTFLFKINYVFINSRKPKVMTMSLRFSLWIRYENISSYEVIILKHDKLLQNDILWRCVIVLKLNLWRPIHIKYLPTSIKSCLMLSSSSLSMSLLSILSASSYTISSLDLPPPPPPKRGCTSRMVFTRVLVSCT